MKRNLLALLITLGLTFYSARGHSQTAVEAWVQRYSNVTESTDQTYNLATDAAGNVIVAGFTAEDVASDILIIKYSSAGVSLWTNRYNGPGNGGDYPAEVAVDSDGNIIVAASSDGALSGLDFVTIKYSSAGVPLWTNRYNGPGNYRDQATDMALDSSGNVFVTGSSTGIGTDDDILTIAYSSAGVPLWTNRYNGLGNGYDSSWDLTLDANGNVYIAGDVYSTSSDYDYTVIKYSNSGATLWVNQYNGPANSYDSTYALAVSSNGNVYVTGLSDGGGFNYDYATVAYSSTGVALWTNRYDGPANDTDEAYAMAVDGSDNVYVTGTSDVGGVANRDYATIKYSSTGVALWTNYYNGPGNGSDFGNAITVAANGNVLVTGSSYSAISYNDYATVALSGAGMVLWVNRYTGPGNSYDQGNAVAVDPSGNVLVTGYSSSSGSQDWATLKYSGAGTALWTNRYNGPGNSYDIANAVAVGASGQIYVTGYSQGIGSGDDWATVAYSSLGTPLWTNRYNGLANSADRAVAVAVGVAVGVNGRVFVAGDSYTGNSDDYLTIAYTSSGTALWTNHYNGPGDSSDNALALAVDSSSGNVYVTGYSYDQGAPDYATIAYSNSGFPLWTNHYNGTANGYDYAQAITVDSSGNVVVTGYSYSDTDNDYTTIKYTSTGVGLWTNHYDGPVNNDDRAQAMAVDSNGNVFVTGFSSGEDTSYDYATIKYSSAGVPVWTNRYNGPSNNEDEAHAIAVDVSGNVYVTGHSRGDDSDYDYATIKYSNAGVALWTNRYNGPGNNEDWARAVVVDASGRVYVTGYSRNSDNNDFATIAYSSAGVALWTNRYSAPGNNSNDEPLSSRSLVVTGDGSVVVVGQSGQITDYTTVKYITVPRLDIRRTTTNTVAVSWPSPSTGFQLQQNTNIAGPNWSFTAAPSDDGTNKTLIVNPPTGSRFYRLIQQ
jgi:uncharacterized delta-60 repeat protein